MMTNKTDLYAIQMQLEEEMRSLGVDRYHRQAAEAKQEGNETRVSSVRVLLTSGHDAVVEGIKEFLTECAAGKATRNGTAYLLLKDIDPNLSAHLALRTVLDSVSTRETINSSANNIGMMIEDELHYKAFKDQDKKGFGYAIEKANNSPSKDYKRRHLRELARKKGVQFAEWSRQERLRVGLKLIEIVHLKTGLVEPVRIQRGINNSPILLCATDKTLKWIEQSNDNLEALSPVFLPTVIPPKPWTDLSTGGYFSGRVRRLRLVKAKPTKNGKSIVSEEVKAAVNAVQETPWRINRRVLDVMSDLFERGVAFDLVPSPDKLDLPTKPLWLTEDLKKEDMTEAQREQFAQWKRLTAQVYEENARMTCRRITFIRKLWVARKFVDFDAIYFPHNLDFRGRMYPVPLYLHPQGDDLARALLEFSEGQPIGNHEGVRWLAAHGAGMWGVDKVTFEERYRWVRDHEQDILASAQDPINNVFWATAEKPWLALAFCFEWAGFIRDGLDYVSNLPVQMDGSCNGLQHFSAMLRDPVGGRAVNLIPGDKPSDIYAEVASVVSKLVERDAMSDDEEVAKLARGWLGNVSRKVTKRPVMTLAYGAKQYGFSQMVFDDTVTPWRISSHHQFPLEGNGWMAAQYMAGLIWESVGQVVVSARTAMGWLQDCAKACSEQDMEISWTTPDGFTATQRYSMINTQRLGLTFGGQRLRLSMETGNTEKLDKHKQTNGIAPNFVHSLDACHLRRTVVAAVQHGITAFSLIHDSYGAHACNCGELARLLREEFFRLYDENDVLAQFAEGLGVKTPDLPEKGTLLLGQVLDSQFFFA
jgi:DNA-directed RNA polymerase, mitochondrial